ncbi:MAG: complex I subunit 5 family protein [Candidatus Thorarchaeota archaeon]
MQLDIFYIPQYGVVMPVVVLVLFALLVAVLSELSATVKGHVPRGLPDGLAVIGFAFALLYTYLLGVDMWANGAKTYVWSWAGTTFGPPVGVVMGADQLSVMLMGLFSFMGLVVSIYSIGYMKEDTGLRHYYALLLIMVGAMNGVVISGDLFTLFMFYETMGLTSFVLVAFRRNWEGIEAAIKYLMMSAVGSTLILYSASYLYGLTGTLNLGEMSALLQTHPDQPIVPILIALMTAGFGVKGAVVPFAAWLADAHPAAPSGISAMLSGVVIKVGIYGIIRMNTLLFPIRTVYFNWPLLIAVFAVVTMTAGNFWALTQTDLKRMLAYSSITQIGFILFAFGTATEFGYQTGSFYIINHALTKGLLFLCAGAFLHAIGSRNLDDLRGIGKKMPVTGAFFAIGILSLMGMPPLAGFYAKFLILAAGVQAGLTVSGYYLVFSALAIFNAVLALGYYLRMLSTVWFKPLSEKAASAHGTSRSMAIGMGILALALVVIGIYPAPIYTIAEAAGSALMNFSQFAALLSGAP